MFFVKFFKYVHVDGKPRLVLFGRFQPELVKQYHRELFRRIYIESFTGVRVNLCGERFDFVLVFFPKFFQNPDVDFHTRTFHIEQNPFKRQFDIVIQRRKILAFKFLFEVVADCEKRRNRVSRNVCGGGKSNDILETSSAENKICKKSHVLWRYRRFDAGVLEKMQKFFQVGNDALACQMRCDFFQYVVHRHTAEKVVILFNHIKSVGRKRNVDVRPCVKRKRLSFVVVKQLLQIVDIVNFNCCIFDFDL